MKKYAVIFFLVMFLIGTDTFLVAPLLPTLPSLYKVSPSISGWMVSAYALGYAIFALVSGPLSDGRDRKKIMILGLLGFSVTTFLCGFATSFQLMILYRFLAGVSASFVTPQVWASIPVVSQGEKIVKMMGIASAGLAVSQLVGVPLGSYLAMISWRAPFFVISIISLIIVLIIKIGLPSLNIQSQLTHNKTFLKIYKELLKNNKALHYLIAYLVFQTGTFCMMTFIGSWLTRDFNLTVSGVGTAMVAIGAGNLIGTLFGSKFVVRWGLQKSLIRGILTLCAFYLIIPFSGSLYISELILMLAFIVNGFIFPVLMTILQSTTTTARGTVSSLSNAAMYIGTTIGGVVGGVLFTELPSFFGISYFTVLAYLVSLLIFKYGKFFSVLGKEF